MNTTQSDRDHGIDRLEKLPKVWWLKWVGIGIATASILLIIMYAMVRYYYPKTGPSKALDELVIPVRTDRWTMLETQGRRFSLEILKVGDRYLTYTVSVNDKDHPQEVSLGHLLKLGKHTDVKRIYVRLTPDQGYESAKVPFEWK